MKNKNDNIWSFITNFIGDPFRRWFIISFIIWNYDLFVLLFFGAQKLNNLKTLLWYKNIDYGFIGSIVGSIKWLIERMFGSSITNFLLIPALFSAGWTFVWPKFVIFQHKKAVKHKNEQKNIDNDLFIGDKIRQKQRDYLDNDDSINKTIKQIAIMLGCEISRDEYGKLLKNIINQENYKIIAQDNRYKEEYDKTITELNSQITELQKCEKICDILDIDRNKLCNIVTKIIQKNLNDAIKNFNESIDLQEYGFSILDTIENSQLFQLSNDYKESISKSFDRNNQTKSIYYDEPIYFLILFALYRKVSILSIQNIKDIIADNKSNKEYIDLFCGHIAQKIVSTKDIKKDRHIISIISKEIIKEWR